MFNVKDWYWLASDGRVYSSARLAQLTTSDAGYQAFVAANGGAGSWPQDASGNQTLAALQEVLSAYGAYVDLKAYTAAKRFNIETGGTTINGTLIATDRESQAMISGAFNMATNNPSFTTQWKNDDGTFTALTAAQIISLAVAVGNFVSSCFSKEATTVAAITAGTITTTAQVDAVFAS